MKLEVIQHPTGERIPIILDGQGLPVPAPNEWILSRRDLSGNTLTRNGRELLLLMEWLDDSGIDLESRLRSDRMFTEAELNGGLIERLRHSVKKAVPGKAPVAQNLTRIGSGTEKTPVGEETFNQRLLTVRNFLVWAFGVELGRLSSRDPMYTRMTMHQQHVERIIDKAFIAYASPVSSLRKSFTRKGLEFFNRAIHYKYPAAIGVNESVKFRNYICAMIMLMYGLRMGELLSLRVQDIVFGSISELRVVRRPVDPYDARRPPPRVKRLARQLPLDNDVFARELSEYIEIHREAMMDNGDVDDHDYLIVSDEGEPLHLNTLGQYFRQLRIAFCDSLPPNLTSKMLRHTFSMSLERRLREAGFDEEHRRQTLAGIRGDSRLESQDTYIRAGIVESANEVLKQYHADLIPEF
jgi:integrase